MEKMSKQEGIMGMIDDLRSIPDSKLSREGCLELADYIDELQEEVEQLKRDNQMFAKIATADTSIEFETYRKCVRGEINEI
jgi:hypothetical protein